MTRSNTILSVWVPFVAAMSSVGQGAEPPPKVFLAPNFHPACCGWLTDWSTERNYCANSYLDHLDRVRDDPKYAFALSEVPNMIAMLNFEPNRAEELRQRISEGRVELVNGLFLEPAISLSGGEALVKMGVEGLRWQTHVLGSRPRFCWVIDHCGMHEQMAQITVGLGLDALIYTRNNPTGSTVHWLRSPDGTKTLALCPGHYSEWGNVFATQQPLKDSDLRALALDARRRAEKRPLTSQQIARETSAYGGRPIRTPAGLPLLILGGRGDYNTAPACKEYPSQFIERFKKVTGGEVLFTTPSKYLDAILPAIKSEQVKLPTMEGGTSYTFDAFWIENPRVKSWYRRAEHGLQAAEALATIASLKARFDYPVQPLYGAWLEMLLNMDRNTLWGSAGGMVFEHRKSWDVRDRFQSVESISMKTIDGAVKSMYPEGDAIALFNPLNWERSDPLLLQLPPGCGPAGAVCQRRERGAVVCRMRLPSVGIVGVEIVTMDPAPIRQMSADQPIETNHYVARIDPATGALVSLKLKPSGREVLGGPANVIVAERPQRFPGDPGDFVVYRAERKREATSSQFKPTITVTAGPLATIVDVRSEFYGGKQCRRVVWFHKDYPRIDCETEVEDIPDKAVVVAEFPLAEPIQEVRRGVPYGFSHGAWATPNPNLHGWTKNILPAVRWSHYAFASGGGLAILDRGLTGRELIDKTPILFLLNATDHYYGYPNAWLSGQGKHRLSYALVAHDGDWQGARIPRMAWEFNCPPIVVPARAKAPAQSFVRTSDNVIVEVVRRERTDIEVRLAECLGLAGTAEVTLNLPHQQASMTDLLGRNPTALEGGPTYRFPIRPQQIVTLRFRTERPVGEIVPLTRWDELVPPNKLKALNTRILKKGHPPRGNEIGQLPDDETPSLTTGRKATASNVYQNLPEHGPDKAVDGDPATRWATDNGVHQAWLEVDLLSPAKINRAFISEAYDRVQEFELQCRQDGQWQTFARGGKIGRALDMKFPAVTAQRVRLNITKATEGPTIWEFQLFKAD